MRMSTVNPTLMTRRSHGHQPESPAARGFLAWFLDLQRVLGNLARIHAHGLPNTCTRQSKEMARVPGTWCTGIPWRGTSLSPGRSGGIFRVRCDFLLATTGLRRRTCKNDEINIAILVRNNSWIYKRQKVARRRSICKHWSETRVQESTMVCEFKPVSPWC